MSARVCVFVLCVCVCVSVGVYVCVAIEHSHSARQRRSEAPEITVCNSTIMQIACYHVCQPIADAGDGGSAAASERCINCVSLYALEC